MTLGTWLLIPPVAFLIMLAFAWLTGVGYKPLAIKPSGPQSPGKLKPYACGEDVTDHVAQPDYSQFFHFAFFFTIMHVVALVVATVPVKAFATAILAGLYLLSATLGLFILFRR